MARVGGGVCSALRSDTKASSEEEAPVRAWAHLIPPPPQRATPALMPAGLLAEEEGGSRTSSGGGLLPPSIWGALAAG